MTEVDLGPGEVETLDVEIAVGGRIRVAVRDRAGGLVPVSVSGFTLRDAEGAAHWMVFATQLRVAGYLSSGSGEEPSVSVRPIPPGDYVLTVTPDLGRPEEKVEREIRVEPRATTEVVIDWDR